MIIHNIINLVRILLSHVYCPLREETTYTLDNQINETSTQKHNTIITTITILYPQVSESRNDTCVHVDTIINGEELMENNSIKTHTCRYLYTRIMKIKTRYLMTSFTLKISFTLPCKYPCTCI